jgi:hypothetical protein
MMMQLFEAAWLSAIEMCREYSSLHSQMPGALASYDKKPGITTPMNFKAVTATIKAVGKKDPNLLPCGYSLPSCLIPSAGQWQTSAIIAKDGVRKLGDRYIHDMVTLKDALDVEEQARLEARAAYKQKIRFRNRSAEAKAVAKQHRLRTALLFVDCYHNTNKIMAVVEGNELVVNGLLPSFMKVAKNSEKDLMQDVNYKLDYRCRVFSSINRKTLDSKEDPDSDEDSDSNDDDDDPGIVYTRSKHDVFIDVYDSDATHNRTGPCPNPNDNYSSEESQVLVNWMLH